MIAGRENDESPSRGQEDRGWGSAPPQKSHLEIALGNRIAKNRLANQVAMVTD